MCRAFLSDEKFSSFDMEYVAPERIIGAYNNCLHSVWTPTVLPEDVPIESSLDEQKEQEVEPELWRQLPPTNSHAFMSFCWKGMKNIFRGQIRLRKQEEQTTRLDRIEEGLCHSQSAVSSASTGPSRRRG